METGAEAAGLMDQREHRDRPRHLLFLDADLAGTAALAGPLIDPVLAGRAVPASNRSTAAGSRSSPRRQRRSNNAAI